MVRSFIAYLSPRSFKEDLQQIKFLECDLSNIVDTDHSEIPHEHKCAHILALDNGNYAAQPNNRLIWSIPSFTVRDEIPFDWKVQTSEWNVEDSRKWKTEDTDKFFYNIEETKDDKKGIVENKTGDLEDKN